MYKRQNGIRVIQVDEAALREKLPLRRSDWYKEYLDWAIPVSYTHLDVYKRQDNNPTIYLTAKGGGVPQKDKAALTDEQAARLLDAIQG